MVLEVVLGAKTEERKVKLKKKLLLGLWIVLTNLRRQNLVRYAIIDQGFTDVCTEMEFFLSSIFPIKILNNKSDLAYQFVSLMYVCNQVPTTTTVLISEK